eukprot:scaffold22716_cov76-Phaeocystis_antarctica.AAC.2
MSREERAGQQEDHENFTEGIHELSTIAHLAALTNDTDAVFLDVDDTLISFEPSLSAEWGRAVRGVFEAAGVETAAARMAMLKLWTAEQCAVDHVAVVAVEDDTTRAAVDALARRGIVPTGLTARSAALAAETAKQLRDAGLGEAFSQQSLGVLVPGDVSSDPPKALHEQGVLFCGGADKGEVLLALERAEPERFASRRIVFVDDRRPNLEKVQAAFVGRRFLGLHYTATVSTERYKLDRCGTLVAAAMANAKGRQHLREALELLDDDAADRAAQASDKRGREESDRAAEGMAKEATAACGYGVKVIPKHTHLSSTT